MVDPPAGLGTDPEGFEVARQLGIELPAELPTGILAVVDLVEIVPVSDVGADPFATGPFCWRLARPRLLSSPVPYRGNQSLMRVPLTAFADAVSPEACAELHFRCGRERQASLDFP